MRSCFVGVKTGWRLVLALLTLEAGSRLVARAQDEPGISIGGFYERIQDNEVSDELRIFDYYGVRLQWRDARWVTLYADLGLARGEWNHYEAEGSGLFGVGLYFWAWRAEDLALPLDIGLHGAVYAGNLEWEKEGADGNGANDSYRRFIGQAVFRADMGQGVRPMVRVGVVRLSGEAPDGHGDEEWKKTRPSVGVGLEYAPHPHFSVGAEGNYIAGPGFAVGLAFWF